ncbi:hypothetical protein ACFQJ7_16355 [Halovenus rubra]|uniref:Uncharacterized protein n=2 Tax=Halovenus rubra TaxID=869890 RepID=A0ACC7DVD9_9EURY|nr:hypothetical protein [Halovenus rubra]
MISRRRYLGLLPIAGLTGCLSSDADPTEPLGKVSVDNFLRRPVTVTVTIEKEGETRHTAEYQLRAYKEEEHDHPELVTIQEPWMGDTVNYTATFDVPSVGKSTYSSEKHEEDFTGSGCWSIAASIDTYDDGREIIDIAVGGLIEGAVTCP